MARSKGIWGPYESCPYNPVLTNANTTEYRKQSLRKRSFLPTYVDLRICLVQTVGHADLFDDANGNWWAVALATRDGIVNL